MLNLVSPFEYSAREFPIKKAVVFGEQSFTFAQVLVMVNKFAHALTAQGIGKGYKVALSCPNLPFSTSSTRK